MGLSYMGLNFFKEIAKMSLELLGLLLELLLLLLHVFVTVPCPALPHLARFAPPRSAASVPPRAMPCRARLERIEKSTHCMCTMLCPVQLTGFFFSLLGLRLSDMWQTPIARPTEANDFNHVQHLYFTVNLMNQSGPPR